MQHPRVIIFDGLCNLCARLVIFAIRHDSKARFRFVSAQSSRGMQLQAQLALDALATQTIILVKNGMAFQQSDAVLEIAAELDGIGKYLALLRIVPRFLRDPIYRFFAIRRYRWFGMKQACMVPPPEVRNRFLK